MASKNSKTIIIVGFIVLILVLAGILFLRRNGNSRNEISPPSAKSTTSDDIELYGLEFPQSVCDGSSGYIKGKIQIKTQFDQNAVLLKVLDNKNNVLYEKERYFVSGDNEFEISFTPKDYDSKDYVFVTEYKSKEAYRKKFTMPKETPKLEIATDYQKRQIDTQPRGKLAYYLVEMSINSQTDCSISSVTITPTASFEATGEQVSVKTMGGAPFDKMSIIKLESHQIWKKPICVIEKESPVNYNHYDYESTYGVSSDFAMNEMCFIKISEPSNLMLQLNVKGKGLDDITKTLRVDIPEIGFPVE